MKNHFSADKDYNLWVLLSQARVMLFRARDKELSQYGITARQAAVLFAIKALNATEGKATPAEISRWLLREPHTVSRILSRMEKDGLVSKMKGSGKKRKVCITLTEEGEQAYRHTLKRESIREIMSCLSEEEHQQLNSMLKTLRDRAIENLKDLTKVPFP